MTRNLIICTACQLLLGCSKKESEVGQALIPHGRDEKCTQNFGWITWNCENTKRSRHRWEYSIKMDLKETGWNGMNWIHVV
jgi:hypothetical protein